MATWERKFMYFLVEVFDENDFCNSATFKILDNAIEFAELKMLDGNAVRISEVYRYV